MTFDLIEQRMRSALQEAADSEAPRYLDLDPDAVLWEGRRVVQRRRRLLGVGAAAASTALAVVMYTAFGGSDGGGRTLPATPRPSTSTSATSSYLTIRGLTDTFREQFVITHVTGEDTFEVRSSVNPRVSSRLAVPTAEKPWVTTRPALSDTLVVTAFRSSTDVLPYEVSSMLVLPPPGDGLWAGGVTNRVDMKVDAIEPVHIPILRFRLKGGADAYRTSAWADTDGPHFTDGSRVGFIPDSSGEGGIWVSPTHHVFGRWNPGNELVPASLAPGSEAGFTCSSSWAEDASGSESSITFVCLGVVPSGSTVEPLARGRSTASLRTDVHPIPGDELDGIVITDTRPVPRVTSPGTWVLDDVTGLRVTDRDGTSTTIARDGGLS